MARSALGSRVCWTLALGEDCTKLGVQRALGEAFPGRACAYDLARWHGRHPAYVRLDANPSTRIDASAGRTPGLVCEVYDMELVQHRGRLGRELLRAISCRSSAGLH